MAELGEVMGHVCQTYPHKADLSNARLTKMIYLADWRMAITSQRQITTLSWRYNRYGPFLDDVKVEAEKHPERFTIRESKTPTGTVKNVIGIVHEQRTYVLDDEETKVLDFVIEKTKSLSWGDFIKFVYSTYPIATQPRFSTLNLVALAAKYEEAQEYVEAQEVAP
jgi:hypothetical protein